MSFYDLATILSTSLSRAANVSPDRVEQAVADLTASGVIHPVKTPTGRTLLTPPDGKRVYDAIKKGR